MRSKSFPHLATLNEEGAREQRSEDTTSTDHKREGYTTLKLEVWSQSLATKAQAGQPRPKSTSDLNEAFRTWQGIPDLELRLLNEQEEIDNGTTEYLLKTPTTLRRYQNRGASIDRLSPIFSSPSSSVATSLSFAMDRQPEPSTSLFSAKQETSNPNLAFYKENEEHGVANVRPTRKVLSHTLVPSSPTTTSCTPDNRVHTPPSSPFASSPTYRMRKGPSPTNLSLWSDFDGAFDSFSSTNIHPTFSSHTISAASSDAQTNNLNLDLVNNEQEEIAAGPTKTNRIRRIKNWLSDKARRYRVQNKNHIDNAVVIQAGETNILKTRENDAKKKAKTWIGSTVRRVANTLRGRK